MIAKESILRKFAIVVDARCKLSGKIGLDELFEFPCEHRHNNSKSENSCLFVSCVSSNTHRNKKNLCELTAFEESF